MSSGNLFSPNIYIRFETNCFIDSSSSSSTSSSSSDKSSESD